MEQIIAILKTLGIEVPEDQRAALFTEMKKCFATSNELEQKKTKIATLEKERDDLLFKSEETEKKLGELQGVDIKEWEDKVKDLTKTLETEREERKKQDERTSLETMVSEFFSGKTFVNDMTKDYIKGKLLDDLQKDTAKGRSIADLFDSITKDEKGDLKPNILIDEKTLEAEKNRSKILGRSITSGATGLKITKEQFLKMNIEERTKLKEADPDTYDALRKMR